MRLVLARAGASRGLLTAAGLAALATTVLITAFVQYAVLLPPAGARAALAGAPGDQRSIVVTSGAGRGADDLAARDAAVRELLAPGLAGAPLRVHTGGYGVAHRLPDDLPGAGTAAADGRYAVVAYLPDLQQFATLVDGAWPRPVADGRPAQVALPDAVADALGLAVGDRVVLLDESLGEQRVVTVVGRFAPVDPADPYWLLGAGRLGEGRTGPFVVHHDEFVARYQWRGTMEWLAVADPGDLVDAGVADVAAAVGELRAALAQRRDERAAGWDASASLSTGLDDLAGRLAAAGVVTRSGLLLPAALLAVIAVYSLALLARLLATHRQGEEALLRARGAGRGQVARFAAAEAALVVTPAAVLGGPLASWLVGQADRRAGVRSLGLAADLAGHGPLGPPLAWALAAGVAAGCAAAFALPGLGRGRTWVAEQQERSRPRRTPALRRLGVDVVLVALAVLAWTQLGRYGSAVTPRAGGLGVDPLLVLAPVVAVLAATMLALRLLPVATRAGVWLASRRDTLPTLLGMWQADRRPHAGPVLLLVLALAVAVLAPTVAVTWQRSQRDQAGHAVGADLRLTAADAAAAAAASAGLDRSAVPARLAGLPEVAAAMPVHRAEITLPDGSRVPVLALDSARAAEVTRLRPDLVTGDAAALFRSLRADRPEPHVLPLPAGTRRLAGSVTFEVPRPAGGTLADEGEGGRVTYRPPASRLPTLYVTDADGAVHSLALGRLAPGGELEFDVALPAGAVAVVGLGAGLIATADAVLPVGELTARWRWRDLRAVTGDGERVPLTLPERWAVVTPPDREPAGLRLSREGAVVTAVADRPVTGSFLLTDPAEVPPAPAVSTPRVLAATGGDASRTVALAAGRMELVGTVAAVPGAADGDGLLVDLAWLSLQRFRELRPPPVVNEWWVATDTPQPVLAVAEELGLSVQRRDLEAERLLADPLGGGVLLAQWAAAAGAALLAAFGLVVDSRVTAAARRRELAVLYTLGAAPRGLAGALVVEQAVLAGLGVLAGVAVGVGVAAAMGTSLILTATGAVPVPPPLLTVPPAAVALPAAGLLALAAALGALTAGRLRREATAGALRIGEE